MAKTQIADVIVPRIQLPYIIKRTAQLSRFFASGIVRNDTELDAIATGAGKTFDLPFWKDLEGDSEELSDSGALTPGKIVGDKDTCVKHFRGKAWSANDLAGVLTNEDPIRAIGDLLAAWWARDMQKNTLIPTLNGMFANALATTHVSDISRTTAGTQTDANRIGSDSIIDALGKLGDAWEQITAIAMHSVVFQRLQKLGLIEFVSLTDQNIQVPFFLGREVIVDDGVDFVAAAGGVPAKYSCYLFAQGSIAYGNGGPNDNSALETDRDILAGDDILASRQHFIFHPRGCAFTGSISGVTPTKAELQDGANWTKKWENKQIPIVKLIVNQ